MMAALAMLAPLIGAAAPKKTSGSPVFYIIIIVGVGFYFLIYRPQQKKAKALRDQGNTFDVGDEVLTAGGIVGHIIDIDGDRVTLETSVGASFVVLKQYVLRRLDNLEPTDHGDDGDEDDDHDDAIGELSEQDEHEEHEEHDEDGDGEDGDGDEAEESDTAHGDDDDSNGRTRPPKS